MNKLTKKKLGKEVRKSLKNKARQQVLVDLAEDLMLIALDPENEELSLKQKLNVARDIYKNNPDLKLFDKDSSNIIQLINYSVKQAEKAEKQAKKLAIKEASNTIEVTSFG